MDDIKFTDLQLEYIDIILNTKLSLDKLKDHFGENYYAVSCSEDVKKEIRLRKIARDKKKTEVDLAKQQGFSQEIIYLAVARVKQYLECDDDKLAIEAIKLVLKGKVSYAVAYQARRAEKDSGAPSGDEKVRINVVDIDSDDQLL